MNSIAIMPARGGSRRIPRKNIRPFFGKPIIAYSIEMAKACGLFDEIVVSSDSAEIRDIALQYGAKAMPRSVDMSRNEIGTQDVAADLLCNLKKCPEYACCIYATAPLMSADDIKRGFVEVKRGALFAFSVGTMPLCDAGQFYWGRSINFGCEPLYQPLTAMIPIVPERVCDINTPADWNRALEMYAQLHGLTVNPEEIMQ